MANIATRISDESETRMTIRWIVLNEEMDGCTFGVEPPTHSPGTISADTVNLVQDRLVVLARPSLSVGK